MDLRIDDNQHSFVAMAYEDRDAPSHQRDENEGKDDRDSCGMARAVDLIGDRWTLLILREALFGVTRFDAIQTRLGCPRSILSGRLRSLVDAEILMRRTYQEPGQRKRSQYVLTGKGIELSLPMLALMQWGEKHCLDDAPALEIVERDSGAPVRVSLVSGHDAPIAVGDTTLRKRAPF